MCALQNSSKQKKNQSILSFNACTKIWRGKYLTDNCQESKRFSRKTEGLLKPLFLPLKVSYFLVIQKKSMPKKQAVGGKKYLDIVCHSIPTFPVKTSSVQNVTVSC